MEEGVRSRQVILPKGGWYNFWDDALITGANEITLDAPLERIPVLVRAGSLIPMEEGEQLILHVYPPVQGSSEGCLYSDAGDGYGEWRCDRFRMGKGENGIELTWEQQGDYPFPYTSVRVHLHGMELQQAWIDGKEVSCQGNVVECARQRLIDNHVPPFKQVWLQGKIA
jgi:alpha-glucosidase